MRGLPFFKPKKGIQFAGEGFTDSSGGGGSGYTLPTATASRLGGVKIGSGISVTNDGTISVSGGGGGSDIGTVTTITGTLNSTGEHTVRANVTSFDWVFGYVEADYSGEGRYRFPIGFYKGTDQVQARLQGNNLQILFSSSGANNITYKLFVGNLQ